jgi:uncharacterized protein (DUF2062 family)
MARKLFKNWFPDPAAIKDRPGLQFLGSLLHDPNLFHMNRHSVSVAFAIGLFMAFMPVLGQMPAAAFIAFCLRANLPIAVALVWISNPVTIPPIFYATYEFGSWVLDTPPNEFTIELSWEWFTGTFMGLWKPLLVGSLICASFFSITGYFSIQLFWRWHVVRNWEKRKEQRLRQAAKDES